jgi:hypothetical protein
MRCACAEVIAVAVSLAAGGLGGCQHAPDSAGAAAVVPTAMQGGAGTRPASMEVPAAHPLADVPAAELRAVLSELARAHEQKGMLATWVALPLVGPPVNASIRPFYGRMGPRQADLLKELRAIARERGIDLTYRPGTDTEGRAYALMEARQEKMVRAAGAADFDRDMLMQMYNDYEWQICLLQALLPRVKDSALRGYLERSLKVHEEGSAEIVSLLKRFKFAG